MNKNNFISSHGFIVCIILTALLYAGLFFLYPVFCPTGMLNFSNTPDRNTPIVCDTYGFITLGDIIITGILSSLSFGSTNNFIQNFFLVLFYILPSMVVFVPVCAGFYLFERLKKTILFCVLVVIISVVLLGTRVYFDTSKTIPMNETGPSEPLMINGKSLPNIY